MTIAGESSGAGSVMLHAIAAGGTLGAKNWQNVSFLVAATTDARLMADRIQAIAASPYDPGQENYDAARPTQRYYDFATKAGCGSSGAVFDCLVSKDSLTLQYASSNVSASGTYATW